MNRQRVQSGDIVVKRTGFCFQVCLAPYHILFPFYYSHCFSLWKQYKEAILRVGEEVTGPQPSCILMRREINRRTTTKEYTLTASISKKKHPKGNPSGCLQLSQSYFTNVLFIGSCPQLFKESNYNRDGDDVETLHFFFFFKLIN